MKRSCFTLIEMLVVIAVIALLVAILIPVLQSSKERTKAVVCGSNIKQLTVGLLAYDIDNQSFPYGFYGTFTEPPGGYTGNFEFDNWGWWWFHYTSGDVRGNRDEKTTLWCPSRRIDDPKFDFVLHGNYGVNQSICRNTGDILPSRKELVVKPLQGGDIPHAARTLLIVDSGYSIIGWWHATDNPPEILDKTNIKDTSYVPGLEINKERDLWPSQIEDAVYGRHPNKTVNVGFADGTVARKKADDLFVEKADDTYINRSPLWLPK
ncbi:MAG: type II secretion system protein [Planctomycetota bacterium]